ncbi:MAG TPA: hypothetical protein O0X13_01350 [Methanocorpusculum sp.]|nr:hypothetical protein [Methanocorpusculum sp.]
MTEKLGNALIYIVRCYPTFGRVQLVKTIFIADLIHSNLCGTLMFPSEYMQKQFGPVSCLAMNLTSSQFPQPFLKTTQKIIETYNLYTYSPKVSEDLSDIPTYQLKILDAAARFVQSKGRATDISDFTHKFLLWKNTEPNTIIPEACFQLNNEDCSLLASEAGICLTPFAKEFCRAIQTTTNPSEIKVLLPKLSCAYPDNPLWDEWLDAYLAWDSAMMFCCTYAPESDTLDDLRDKGLELIAGITCSGTDPERFLSAAIKYEQYFNQICDRITPKEDIELSDSEKKSVNSVMQAARRELELDE